MLFKFFCAVMFSLCCTEVSLYAKVELDCQDFELCGIYVGASNDILNKVEKAKNLNINAVVIDIKNDCGEITCDLENPKIKYTSYIKNIKQLLTRLKSMGIYTIARIVTFKDKFQSSMSKKFAIRNVDGTIYVDEEKMSWTNPYSKKVWIYLTEIAEAAAKLGFDEIQFDYIRLPQYESLEKTSIKQELQAKSKMQIINEFLDFIVPKIRSHGAKVSADVFGCVIPEALGENSSQSSKKLGQNYIQMAEKIDYICPMIYPSHWPAGSLGIEKPDLNPGKIVQYSMKYSNMALSNKKSKARPWIQAFTATWLKCGYWKKYGMKELQEQVNALKALGIKQFCFWNTSANYEF